MLRFSQRTRGGLIYPTALGFFGIELFSNDDPGQTPTALKMQEQVIDTSPIKGWEGLKSIFRKQEPHGVSIELLSCIQLGLGSTVFGFILGGIDNTKHTVADFKERNMATVYQNTFDAQRSLQDHVAKDFFRGGFKMGIKYGSFLFCYSLMATSISVYRGKTSISDFALGGCATGALYSLNRGLPGVVSGGTVGLFLGTLTGCAMVGLLYAAGIDIHEVRMWQYNQYLLRTEVEHKAYLKEREDYAENPEKVAYAIIKPEEREKGRFVDTLEELAKPVKSEVTVPLTAPVSMHRKEES